MVTFRYIPTYSVHYVYGGYTRGCQANMSTPKHRNNPRPIYLTLAAYISLRQQLFDGNICVGVEYLATRRVGVIGGISRENGIIGISTT